MLLIIDMGVDYTQFFKFLAVFSFEFVFGAVRGGDNNIIPQLWRYVPQEGSGKILKPARNIGRKRRVSVKNF